MILKTGAEFATAVIDLATGLILLALTAAGLYGKDWREKKLGKSWLCVLIMLSFGNILGFAAHAFRWTETVFDVIWIFIYPFMYGVAVSFAVHALIYVTKGRLPGAGLKTASVACRGMRLRHKAEMEKRLFCPACTGASTCRAPVSALKEGKRQAHCRARSQRNISPLPACVGHSVLLRGKGRYQNQF